MSVLSAFEGDEIGRKGGRERNCMCVAGRRREFGGRGRKGGKVCVG